jgi:hypothetical protein
MKELDEILGPLHSVEKTEAGLIVLIGRITVTLPLELYERLRGLVGKKTAILRLDGYHIRAIKG